MKFTVVMIAMFFAYSMGAYSQSTDDPPKLAYNVGVAAVVFGSWALLDYFMTSKKKN